MQTKLFMERPNSKNFSPYSWQNKLLKNKIQNSVVEVDGGCAWINIPSRIVSSPCSSLKSKWNRNILICTTKPWNFVRPVDLPWDDRIVNEGRRSRLSHPYRIHLVDYWALPAHPCHLHTIHRACAHAPDAMSPKDGHADLFYRKKEEK